MICIDMDMPNSCLDCKFMKIIYDKLIEVKQNDTGIECTNITNKSGHFICRLENSEIKKEWEKPSWCPLKEIKE